MGVSQWRDWVEGMCVWVWLSVGVVVVVVAVVVVEGSCVVVSVGCWVVVEC